MAWSFRKRVKIIPGVHLNFSRGGISTSIGIRGASLNISGSGTRLNTSIPGVGTHNSQKLSSYSKNISESSSEIVHLHHIHDDIISADVHEVTSQNMQGVKESIILAHEQRNELAVDLLKVRNDLKLTNYKILFSKVLLYGFIFKSILDSLKKDIVSQEEAISELQNKINECYVDLDIEFDAEIGKSYAVLVESFKKLSTSEKIWDVTSAYSQDTKVTRSAAATVVAKREVKFETRHIPDIKSRFEPFSFRNANGADLCFYPSFVVVYSSNTRFAVIGLDEIKFNHTQVRFTETGSVPRDSKVIDKTWFKVNKNGTPDKRFKDNYQIPVVRYGEITLKSNTGLHEEYEFSNYEFCEEFGQLFTEYQSQILSLRLLNNS